MKKGFIMMKKSILMGTALALAIAGSGAVFAFAGYMIANNNAANDSNEFMQEARPIEDKECVIVDDSQVVLYDSDGVPAENDGGSPVTGKKPNN